MWLGGKAKLRFGVNYGIDSWGSGGDREWDGDRIDQKENAQRRTLPQQPYECSINVSRSKTYFIP